MVALPITAAPLECFLRMAVALDGGLDEGACNPPHWDRCSRLSPALDVFELTAGGTYLYLLTSTIINQVPI